MVLARIRIYIYIYIYGLDKGERRCTCMFTRAVGFI